MPKNFVQEPFSVSLISGIEKFQDSEGYVTIFCRIFSSDTAENFVEDPFSAVFQKSSASENVYGKEGRGRVPSFHVTIFCLLVLKIFVKEPF